MRKKRTDEVSRIALCDVVRHDVAEILYENGAVTGVKVVDEYNDSRILNAKSVIVATGGFSANSEMVVKYRPELDGFVTTNHKGATGSGIAMLQKIGADTVDMGEIQIHPTVEQTTSYLISESIRGVGALSTKPLAIYSSAALLFARTCSSKITHALFSGSAMISADTLSRVSISL